MNRQSILRISASVLSAAALLAPLAGAAQQLPAWVDRGADWANNKATLQNYGDQFKTSEALYAALKTSAHGGKPLAWGQLGKQSMDWSGVYTRGSGGLQFDPDLPSDFGGPRSADPPLTTARLTPAGAAAVKEKAAAIFAKRGDEFDPLSTCAPPGTPRWLSEPFLREFVITPGQTWLINEMVNDIRRVYTDGRPHTAEADAYATPNGDTIGFWNGDVLVTHTTYLMNGQYQRGVQPNSSDQTSVVERWHKVNPKTIEVDVWVYDPVNLAKPWYVRQTYTKLTNSANTLRIRYWDCGENPNNTVVKTEQGGSDFKDFTFAPKNPGSK
jgi:hypothetical protein